MLYVLLNRRVLRYFGIQLPTSNIHFAIAGEDRAIPNPMLFLIATAIYQTAIITGRSGINAIAARRRLVRMSSS
jgi:hypothetical protein